MGDGEGFNESLEKSPDPGKSICMTHVYVDAYNKYCLPRRILIIIGQDILMPRHISCPPSDTRPAYISYLL